MTDGTDDRSGRKRRCAEADPLHLIHEALTTMRFGAIQLTVHEGKLVQMEVTEKRRFT
ncbi:YezD family protein [Novosphingobium naphthalenivorans]|uniref:YezD family protein n=1 Tax=Novosphingobium naphthalenivorans TaxID=273168 RepID=UPI000A022A16|nr:YezD family protein [Novosphingobium naphthalenivorans]